MRKSFWIITLSVVFALVFLLLMVFLAFAANDLTCSFVSGGSCPAGAARVIGLNDSTNTHAQNNSNTNYAYSICCNSTNTSINITSGCPGNVTVMNLSADTNAHVDITNDADYPYSVCLSSNWTTARCSYLNSCPSPSACVVGMANSEGANNTNAHVSNCSTYVQKICCSLNNSAPTAPTLQYPSNNNITLTERKPTFQWVNSTDSDGDAITYTLTLDCGSCSATCAEPNVTATSNPFTTASTLCVQTPYNWTVTACDKYTACSTSSIFNFSINSVLSFNLIINATSFGDMNLGQTNDTTDDSPTPLVGRNDGNVLINVTINASALFSSVSMNTPHYQFEAALNESNSYTTSCSQHGSFANMNTAEKILFCNMSYEDASDQGNLELSVTTPSASELPGAKNSTIQLTITSLEP